MKNLRRLAFLALAAAFLPALTRPDPPKEQPHGIPARVPWNTSRITGSPDPPHPYKVERAFPKLSFKNPLLLTRGPDGKRFFVGEHAGKLYSFRDEQNVARADLFLDLITELHSWDKAKVKGIEAVYALAFH